MNQDATRPCQTIIIREKMAPPVGANPSAFDLKVEIKSFFKRTAHRFARRRCIKTKA
jgi:hypothetical protein